MPTLHAASALICMCFYHPAFIPRTALRKINLTRGTEATQDQADRLGKFPRVVRPEVQWRLRDFP